MFLQFAVVELFKNASYSQYEDNHLLYDRHRDVKDKESLRKKEMVMGTVISYTVFWVNIKGL